MSNRDIFLWPGEQMFLFVLSLFQTEPMAVPHELALTGVIFCAFLSWVIVFRVSFEVLKKLLGFNGGPRHG